MKDMCSPTPLVEICDDASILEWEKIQENSKTGLSVLQAQGLQLQ